MISVCHAFHNVRQSICHSCHPHPMAHQPAPTPRFANTATATRDRLGRGGDVPHQERDAKLAGVLDKLRERTALAVSRAPRPKPVVKPSFDAVLQAVSAAGDSAKRTEQAPTDGVASTAGAVPAAPQAEGSPPAPQHSAGIAGSPSAGEVRELDVDTPPAAPRAHNEEGELEIVAGDGAMALNLVEVPSTVKRLRPAFEATQDEYEDDLVDAGGSDEEDPASVDADDESNDEDEAESSDCTPMDSNASGSEHDEASSGGDSDARAASGDVVEASNTMATDAGSGGVLELSYARSELAIMVDHATSEAEHKRECPRRWWAEAIDAPLGCGSPYEAEHRGVSDRRVHVPLPLSPPPPHATTSGGREGRGSKLQRVFMDMEAELRWGGGMVACLFGRCMRKWECGTWNGPCGAPRRQDLAALTSNPDPGDPALMPGTAMRMDRRRL